MDFLTSVKKSLRTSHNKLDDDILETIDAALTEMKRLGIDSEKVVIDGETESPDPLILQAVKTYCRFEFASDTAKRDAFEKSWHYQLDCLRKSNDYRLVPYV